MSNIPPIAAFLATSRVAAAPPRRRLKENKPAVVDLGDGRFLHIMVENRAAKKQRVLSEDQKRARYVFGFMAFFLVLIICMVCFLVDSL